MKHIKFLYLFVLISTFSLAQNSTRIFKNVTETKNGLEINVNDGIYYITFYNEKIVETSFVPKGEELQNNSHAVVLKKKDLDVISIVTQSKSIFTSEGISIHIQHYPFQISYTYNNELITSEKQGYYKSKHIPLENVKGNIPNEETEKN